jgi:oligopeptide/dipeptide ABC transporter ATP-binding protein
VSPAPLFLCLPVWPHYRVDPKTFEIELLDSDRYLINGLAFGPDGMAFDVNGKLYVTVCGQGDVTVLGRAAPIPDPAIERRQQRRPLGGEIPSPLTPPSGCVFHTRCPIASAERRVEVPKLREIRPGQFAACLKA